MKNLHINNSYHTWRPCCMYLEILWVNLEQYDNMQPTKTLNRSWTSLYIEWWLHNIGYYVTRPFVKIKPILNLNLRFKDVDLEEWHCKK